MSRSTVAAVERTARAILIRLQGSRDPDPILELGVEPADPRVRRVTVDDRYGGFLHVDVEFAPSGAERIESLVDRWACGMRPPYAFSWAPHLRPGPNHRIGAHTFRSPAVILFDGVRFAAIVPDISDDGCRAWIANGVLDLDRSDPTACYVAYGLEPTLPVDHIYFRRDPDRSIEPCQGWIRYSYDILVGEAGTRADCLRAVVRFIWEKHARNQGLAIEQHVVDPDRLAAVAYETLFGGDRFVEFDLSAGACGGFMAEAAHKDYFRRPDPIVWNQYWFNGQRTAYGLVYYGRKHDRPDWVAAADRITRTSLAAPSWGGLFPAIYAFAEREWWGSVPRLNGGRNRVHTADASATGEWLILYALDHASRFGDGIRRRCADLGMTLAQFQQPDGSIPAWFDWDGQTLTSVETLARSAETAASASFLAALARWTGDRRYADASRRAADFLASEVMPGQRYQDFETFFSCSPKPLDFADPHTGLIPQNSLAVFWTASTMFRVFEMTGDGAYLELAIEATDILSLYQQVWSPPFLSLKTFGGFGVMNTDAEWNDARQSLFAPLYFDAHRLTGDREYLQRGRAALNASFVLACLPEHEVLNPKGFADCPNGIMPENYGHSGGDKPSGRSDTCWGECGALSTAALIETHHRT